MNGTTLASGGAVAFLPADWQIQGTGDFNGDGKSDILWRNTASGEVDIWHMNGTTLAGRRGGSRCLPNWQIQGTGDFNGDGKSDILWRNTTSGRSRYLAHERHHAPAAGGAVATLPLNWYDRRCPLPPVTSRLRRIH